MIDDEIEGFGDTVQRWPVEELEMSLLDGQDENPNVMKDSEFSALVESYGEKGMLEPILVVGPNEKGRYTILGGHHRAKAAMVMDMQSIPAVVVPPDEFTEDEQKAYLVRMNVIKGDLDPEKFTKLFNDLSKKYGADYTRQMMAFTKQDAFKRVYLDARKALPPEMADKLDEVKDELKTVDQLSVVLNKLFSEYGDTLDSNFMVFVFGGKQHLFVQLSQPASYKRMKKFLEWCHENGLLADAEMMTRMQWPDEVS